MRLSLVLVLLLAAILSVTNVQAYKQATATNGATISISSTDAAAMAISSVSAMATIGANGILSIDFSMGNGASREFLSSATLGDSFKMYDVFRVTNGSGQSQCITIYRSSGTATNLAGIYGRIPPALPDGTQLASSTGSMLQRMALAADETMLVDFYWLANSATSANSFVITVDSTHQVPCP